MNLSMLLTGFMPKQSTDSDNLSLSGHRLHDSRWRDGLLRSNMPFLPERLVNFWGAFAIMD